MKKTILVIEDERATRDNLLNFLNSEDFNAIGAENGSIGVELAKSNIPDLIICDILMPEMDGYDVLFYLEQNPETSSIPFIFLTVTNEEDFLAHNDCLNQEDYLRKPVTTEQLRRAIQAKLNEKENNLVKYEKDIKLEEMREKIYKMEEYCQAKDLLLTSLSENLKKYLPTLKKDLNNLRSSSASLDENNRINQIQKDFAKILSLVSQVSDLQQILTPENYKLLEQFKLFKSTNSKAE